jgi:hypothetical protein
MYKYLRRLTTREGISALFGSARLLSEQALTERDMGSGSMRMLCVFLTERPVTCVDNPWGLK